MNNPLSHRLEAAVTALAGHGTLKDRLTTAFTEHLEDIDEQDLPLDVQGEFAAMSQAMHRARALPGDDVVRASVRKLSNEEAQRFASLVVRMYGLRMQSIAEGNGRTPGRMAALARNQTPLAALLAIEGGSAAPARPNMAGRP